MTIGRPHNLEMVRKIIEHLENGLKPSQIATLEGVDRQLIDYYIKTYPQLKKLHLQNKKRRFK